MNLMAFFEIVWNLYIGLCSNLQSFAIFYLIHRLCTLVKKNRQIFIAKSYITSASVCYTTAPITAANTMPYEKKRKLI